MHKMVILGPFAALLVTLAQLALGEPVQTSDANLKRDSQVTDRFASSHIIEQDCVSLSCLKRLNEPTANRSEVIDLCEEHNGGQWQQHLAQVATSGHSFVDTEKWRYKYIDELRPGFQLKLVEKSLDARLANVLYTAIASRPVNIDSFKIDSSEAHLLELIAGPQVDDVKCGRQLEDMVQQMRNFGRRLEAKRRNASLELGLSERDIRLAYALDSFGRYESAHLLGKAFAPGSQEQCLNTALQLSGDEQANSPRFCWARLALGKHLDGALRGRRRSAFEAPESALLVGVCLPRSCHTKSFKRDAVELEQNRRLLQQLVDSQFKLPESLYLDQTLQVEEAYCPVDEQSEHGIPLSGKLFCAFFAAWLALAVYSSWLKSQVEAPDESKNNQSSAWLMALIECFDLRQSWYEFVSDERHTGQAARSPGRVELDTLNPVKALGCAFVILGHAFIIAGGVSANTLLLYNLVENDPVLLGGIVGTIVVDTFFVITGILFGYIAMSRANRRTRVKVAKELEMANCGHNQDEEASSQKEPKENNLVKLFFANWFKFALTRYLRLVPLFFLVFWFKKSIMIYVRPTGSMFWDHALTRTSPLGACKQETWLTPFTFMSAYLPLSHQCLAQSWSVSTDLFFSLTIAPLLILLPRRPKLTLLIMAAVSLASSKWSYEAMMSVHPSLVEELYEVRTHGFALVFGQLAYLYTFPHFRFSSILVGVAAGYLLYEYNKGEKLRDWPRLFKGPMTIAALLVQVAVFAIVCCLPNLRDLIAPYHRALVPHLFSSSRMLWAICNAIVFMRMATDWRNSFLMRQNASKFWKVVVKLNLAILLIHMDYLGFLASTQTSNIYFGKLTILSLFSSALVACIPIAIFLHVVFENPIDKLIRRFILSKL